ncbi:MAG: phosphatidylserine/phosphatidylglycerophosphate/cardiolipin synthase family protein [Ectothiorhodospiraceae bacterium]|jgi:phosphatidylserine/phosphatidylglycerophosphate/cardiolipin synthase-like enzyme|nr:phosphatidylserine/phosphatidylglycerophosphate/cardiolipin synthase family protein [Ectothiorhodospiraceae bacterium]
MIVNDDRRHPLRFPLRGPHRLRLLVDGGDFFPAMLAAIAAARSFVLLEMYLMESGAVSDRFIAALTAAAERGVDVWVLLDDFGSRALTRGDRERLTDAGVRLSIFNPVSLRHFYRSLHRDHRKLLLIDGARAFVGGAGITDAFDSAIDPERHWHELMLEIDGPCVADWQHLFRSVWPDRPLPPDANPPPPGPHALGNHAGRIAIGYGGWRQLAIRSLIGRIRRADRRIWLATAYFAPPLRLRRALRQAARRGVDVRLLLPGPLHDHPGVRHAGRRFYGRLLATGVRIYEYRPRFLHAKLFLCDDWVSVGSCNLDHWTLRWNLEANQEIIGASFAAEAAALLEEDFMQSEEWTYRGWQSRSAWLRMQERLWGTVDGWLLRLSYQRTVLTSRRSTRDLPSF